MDKSDKPDKDDTFWKVLNVALELDFKKGHLKWTISELSRKSGITRSLIYYYFGQSKEGILNAAVKVIGEELVGLTPKRLEMWKSGQFIESMEQARAISAHAPFIGSFILTHRERDTAIAKGLRKVESDFITKIAQFFPHLTDHQVRAIYAIYFGCAFSPLVDSGVIAQVMSAIQSGFLKPQGRHSSNKVS